MRRRNTRGSTARYAATPAIAALILVSGCGSQEPEVTDAPSSPAVTSSDAAPTTAKDTESATSTTEPPAETTSETASETASATSASPTSTQPPEEGAGDPASQGLAVAQDYADLVVDGALDEAYAMLSPEAMAYFPDVSVFEDNGVAALADDLGGASGEPQWAIRSAYEETHDSAQVVSVWGEGDDGEPFAHSWAVRKLDGMSWVIDQDITPSTGGPRLNWLNPGIQEGVQWWEVNPDSPISFALLKSSGPNVAVTASIDDGSEVSQQLTERPTGGAVMYDLSDSALSDGLHVVTASWVAEDEPFVHTRATPAANPGS